MDVEESAGQGGGGTRKRATEDGNVGGGGVEVLVVPPDLYDSARAKIEANLRWLLAKAYGIDHIPKDLQNPFYTDQYEQEHIKPPVIHLLLSGEIYCWVCGLILHVEQATSLQSHQSVLLALSARGIHVRDLDDIPVSALDLSSTPVKMSCHMHLIDALMMACMLEMISVEKVVSSVKRFSNFSASKERPMDLEDAMVLWLNKVNTKMSAISEKEMKMKQQQMLDSPSHQKPDILHALAHCLLEPVEFSRVVRYRRDYLSGRTLQHFSLIEDLCKDVCDGAALLALIHFYCPELIRLEDICLKDVASIADSMYNIQLLIKFSNKYLNKCFYLKPEDILYCPPVLRNNVMVFIAELFWWFEIVKPDFVQPRDLKENRDAKLLLQSNTSRSHTPINVTKRSFPTTSSAADILTTPSILDFSGTVPSTSSSPHSLVPRRQIRLRGLEDDASVRNQCSSLARKEEKRQGLSQICPDRRQRHIPQPAPYALDFLNKEDGTDNDSLVLSVSKDNLASSIMTPSHMLVGPGHPVHQHRLSGQSLLSHLRIEDEEEILEEEELVAVIHPGAFPRHSFRSDIQLDELEIPHTTSPRRVSKTLDMNILTPNLQVDSYYLEPLMPAIPKPSKEKSTSLNKEEESGESRCRLSSVKTATDAPHKSHQKSPLSERGKYTFKPIPSVKSAPNQEGLTRTSLPEKTQPQGFFLHLSGESDCHSYLSSDAEVGQDSDSDIADFEEDDEDVDVIEASRGKGIGLLRDFSEVESFKLREDLKVHERDDKEDWSGRSSPCLSTASCASSCSASGSVKMTSFAEKKLLKLSLRDGFSSTSSSQKTTPDHSEINPCPPWQLKAEGSPGWSGKDPLFALKKTMMASPPVVPSELLQLHMQLEEQRRAIEYQKKKMETLSARQRLKLGKAAFLNIVKKGESRSDTLPLPIKHSPLDEVSAAPKAKSPCCKDDSCLEALKVQAKADGTQINRDNRLNSLGQDSASEADVSDRSRSIDLLNEAISAIQQQMTQLSLQQDLLMKKNAASSAEPKEPDRKSTPPTTQSSTSDPRSFDINFVDFNDSSCTPSRRPPKLSSSQRSKPSGPKQSHKNVKDFDTEAETSPKEMTGTGSQDGESSRMDRNFRRRTTFRIQNDQGVAREEAGLSPVKAQSEDITYDTSVTQSHCAEDNKDNITVREFAGGDDSFRGKGQLIEVDLSELKEPAGDDSTDTTDGEQKNVIGFFFKDDEKAEDEMAKRRAAFMLKQQRKAEEARVRKQQQEAESELKRDEARRKAEEDRVRKEEEKARRELIKQEYLRRKQQALLEEQGQVKPRPRFKTRRSRPKSVNRSELSSPCKGSTTPELSGCLRGSTLSLADTDSVISGEAETQRAESVCSMDSFSVMSRASSRNMERDWESGSIASSITSIEYNGPKLFKEPSSKSNKPIIINAIAHCCLAGKVNEAQKNVLLEELEKCESNHLIILFRDGGCQFRAVYSYSPETEDIVKFTGTGPRSIGHKMIDRLYKYSSDRKQFNVIPAKSVSVSVDALTIHNHLWQAKRPSSARRK
ncbi:calmodulin-regulated spectrin-associated protein 1-B-like isoform X2 [Corythoichthys intestinalis]|uniref:calmodulin-regulated spectrin-associated protein 1-B-like isoform X2 n=1 Tax=Corythoichthys intestinalis TaxID=161448 RepID=UPI0025A562DA|nr:calmodulin-regulated spectrin-associated protein 1-B-like isoform X2 [Corythoichthys intestinalis]